MGTDADWSDEEQAWYATHRAHPDWTYAQIARWHGVERKHVLRAAARRRWRQLAATDPDAVAPPWVDPADIPPWVRQRGESDHEWQMFTAWLASPSHDLSGVAGAFGMPVWEVARAYRVRGWQARLDSWRAEQARQARYQVEASDLTTRRQLARVVARHASRMDALLEETAMRSPEKAIERFTQLIVAAREVPLSEPMLPAPMVTPGDTAQLVSERARIAVRLESVCAALARAAESGDREAAKLYLAFEARRSGLLGLDEPPMAKSQIDGEIAEAEQVREVWEQLRALNSAEVPVVEHSQT